MAHVPVPTPALAPAPASVSETLPPASVPPANGILNRDLGSAGEQYIRDNAWANPKHPAHKASFSSGPPRPDVNVHARGPMAAGQHVSGGMPGNGSAQFAFPPQSNGATPLVSAAVASHAPPSGSLPMASNNISSSNPNNHNSSNSSMQIHGPRPGRGGYVPPISEFARPRQQTPAASS